jgi:DNA-binding LytR/AlgR family response regulator
MNILICDDRPDEAAELDRLLHDSDFKIYTVIFNNGHEALNYALSGAAIDICILDILMPEMDGINLAKNLRTNGFCGEIIFLSTSKEFAPESYEVKAFSYLLKPPTPNSVKHILKQLEYAQKNTDTAKILLKMQGIAKSILLRDIAYIEVIQHKIYFRLCDGSEIIVSGTFKEFSDKLLGDSRFLQCHRSFIVNMDEISEISEWEIKMRHGVRIPITRTFHDARNQYYKWEFGGHKK